MIAKDKILHFGWGAFAGFVGSFLLPISNILGAALLGSALAGVGKEIVDRYGLFFQRRTGFDKMDILATVAGGAAAGLLLMFWPDFIEYLKTTEYLFGGKK